MSITFTMRQAAKKLGLSIAALSRYVSSGKVPAPQVLEVGGFKVHSWTEEQIEHVRELLPKIANGRKTWRRKKQQQSAVSSRQSVKANPKPRNKKSRQSKKQIPRAKTKRSE